MNFSAPQPSGGLTLSLRKISDHYHTGTTQSLFKALEGQAFTAKSLDENIVLIRPKTGYRLIPQPDYRHRQ
jgi:hypothetical protein